MTFTHMFPSTSSHGYKCMCIYVSVYVCVDPLDFFQSSFRVAITRLSMVRMYHGKGEHSDSDTGKGKEHSDSDTGKGKGSGQSKGKYSLTISDVFGAPGMMSHETSFDAAMLRHAQEQLREHGEQLQEQLREHEPKGRGKDTGKGKDQSKDQGKAGKSMAMISLRIETEAGLFEFSGRIYGMGPY